VTLVRNHGVTAPAGFKASAVRDPVDVALVCSEGPDLAAAGVFSDDADEAAAVLWTRQVLTTGRLRAVLLAPAQGPPEDVTASFGDVHRGAEELATTLSNWGTETGAVEVAVWATGGGQPIEPFLAAVAEAVHELAGGISGGTEAAGALAGRRAAAVQVAEQHEDGWTVGGMAGGAGTVCVLTTDAVASTATLQQALNAATANRLPNSPHTTVLLLASGASEHAPTPLEFSAAVAAVYQDLRAQTSATRLEESA